MGENLVFTFEGISKGPENPVLAVNACPLAEASLSFGPVSAVTYEKRSGYAAVIKRGTLLSKDQGAKEAISKWLEALGLYDLRSLTLVLGSYTSPEETLSLSEFLFDWLGEGFPVYSIFVLPPASSDAFTVHESAESLLRAYASSELVFPVDPARLDWLAGNVLARGKKLTTDDLLCALSSYVRVAASKYRSRWERPELGKFLAPSLLMNSVKELYGEPSNPFKLEDYFSLARLGPGDREAVRSVVCFTGNAEWEEADLSSGMVSAMKPSYPSSAQFTLFRDPSFPTDLAVFKRLGALSANYCYLVEEHQRYERLTGQKASGEGEKLRDLIGGCDGL
ncbi:MAG: hypothetical protein ACP5T2_05005 [Thermoprotei archaeon]